MIKQGEILSKWYHATVMKEKSEKKYGDGKFYLYEVKKELKKRQRLNLKKNRGLCSNTYKEEIRPCK